jgi:ribosomal protein L24E
MDVNFHCDYCSKLIQPGEVVSNVGDSFVVIIACEKCAEPRTDLRGTPPDLE